VKQLSSEARVVEVLAATGPVLLDFDGPVCCVYSGNRNVQAAEALRNLLHKDGVQPPPEVKQTHDPLAVLRFTGELDRQPLLDQVERTLTEIEIEAVGDAPGTDGATEFLHACAEAHRPVVIVSNNAPEAIDRYLHTHDLAPLVRTVVGRSHAKPQEMKPHPGSLHRALDVLNGRPHHALMVGDSATDIQVGRQVGLHTVAFVNRPSKLDKLMAQSPDALVDSMMLLADTLRLLRSESGP
jgi:phosphoglycolate phosphatase-like HAD superfamily hydrolase